MTARLLTGWKVITYDRKSVVATQYIGCCEYPVGRRIKPQEGQGPLAVFETKKHAESFVKMYGPFITWGNCPDNECANGGHPYYQQVVPCRYKPSNNDKLGLYWDGNLVQKYLKSMPKGSILAEFVTCLE